MDGDDEDGAEEGEDEWEDVGGGGEVGGGGLEEFLGEGFFVGGGYCGGHGCGFCFRVVFFFLEGGGNEGIWWSGGDKGEWGF